MAIQMVILWISSFDRYLKYHVQPFYGFALEFHIPYYTLRTSELPDPRGLRRHGQLLLPGAPNVKTREFLYEAQISLLITGVDEWFWSAYCCLDTYFEGKDSVTSYHNNNSDALVGGTLRPNWYPVWNVRQYFLFVFSRRFKQATKEWAAIVRALDSRLYVFVSKFNSEKQFIA